MNRALHLVPSRSSAPRTPGTPRTRRFWSARRLGLGLGALVLLACLPVGGLVWRALAVRRTAALLFAPLTATPARNLEARLSYRAADHHRPLAPGRPARVPILSASAQARLEGWGEAQAVAASFALAGETQEAQRRLARLPATPDVLSDLAAAALADPAEQSTALGQLERALTGQPGHPQALWNRGLILSRLGLELSAAQAFTAVASLGEPGWASEAQSRADALAVQAGARRARWRRAELGHRQLVDQGLLPAPDLVAEAPDWMRDGLYEAMRRAPAAAELRRLAPLARALDAAYGEHTLAPALERAAAAATPARAEATRAYALLPAAPSPDEIAAVVRAAHTAGADDVAIGALARTRDRAAAHALTTLVAAGADPWLRLVADERTAVAAIAADDEGSAERALHEALARCRPSRLRYQCSVLLLRLMDVYGSSHRVQPALAAGSEARALALEGNFLPLFVRATVELGIFESHRSASPLAKAYALEAVLWGEPCVEVQKARHYLAETALELHDFAEARRQMAAVERCPERPARFGLAGASVLAELVRDPHEGWVEARAWLDEAMASIRRSPLYTPPYQAAATMLQGWALIEREPVQGRRLLRQAIAEAAALPQGSVLGEKARSHAYLGLIGDAAARGAHTEALALTLELEGVADPGGCLVTLAHHFIRTAAVARGPDGRLRASWNPRSTGAPAEMVLPAELQAGLGDCATIAVVAAPPVLGAPHLLPADWPWVYLAGGHARPAPGPGRRRLVVSDVTPPPALRLPMLRRWRGVVRPGEEVVELRGAAATPAAVLAAMADADVIELHVHGIRDPSSTDAIALALSPGAGDKALLTPADFAGISLARHPLVLLGACEAARAADYGPLDSSLPSALLRAGASLVLASPASVGDLDAGPLLDEFQRRLASGSRPAAALRDVRRPILAKDAAHWSGDLVLFE